MKTIRLVPTITTVINQAGAVAITLTALPAQQLRVLALAPGAIALIEAPAALAVIALAGVAPTGF